LRLFYGWVVVAGAFIVLFVAYGAQYAFGVFFAALLDEFGWSRASLAGTFALYAVAYSAFGFPAGRLLHAGLCDLGRAQRPCGGLAPVLAAILWGVPALDRDDIVTAAVNEGTVEPDTLSPQPLGSVCLRPTTRLACEWHRGLVRDVALGHDRRSRCLAGPERDAHIAAP
jgi:hypothetical protein